MSLETIQLLSTLNTRLPELEWKVSELDAAFPAHSLPRGVFSTAEPSGASCIAEIKADIQLLSQYQHGARAIYLAARIQQKVNVLVSLCQIHGRQHPPEGKISFGIKMLSTRQQWIHTLEADVQTLEQQHHAMTKALEHMQGKHKATTILQLKAELGEIERRLTLAKETLNRAIS